MGQETDSRGDIHGDIRGDIRGDIHGDIAIVGGRILTGLLDVTSDVSALDGAGTWAVVLPFDGPPVCARFERVTIPALGWPAGLGREWRTRRAPAPEVTGWASSLDRHAYTKGVDAVREAIAAGDVYQVNLCRRLSAPLPAGFDLLALGAALFTSHPAPHQALVHLPEAGVAVASASPERFLRRRGDVVESSPIKGTAVTAAGLTDKDRAENVMIVDLVRNDLGRVCEYGSVEVPELWRVESQPGLVHLVSTVRGRLRPRTGWGELLDATFPPGSVTGAPKLAALDAIAALEPVPRGVYCGAVGWVDAERGEADLNVAIRTFWVSDGALHLGTGGGITWESDPIAEWEETELKARRLLAVAAGSGAGSGVSAVR
ncbi:MAG TPA: chorismate-binding protein [Acidimicrobiales bacterium]|nr:chorismate-binding protein [Acidimicrobiales bacterium]